jgi:hypothetical protein
MSDLANEGRCYSWDYSMKRTPTGTQRRSGQPHLVKSPQEQDVEGTASIDEDMVKLDVLDNGADDQRVPTRLWNKVYVVTAVEGGGNLGPPQVLRGGRSYYHDLPGGEFLLPP